METSPLANVTWPHKFTEVPKDVFVREDVYQLELEKIFYGAEWHAIAHESEVPNPGDFKAFELGEVPLLVVRGDDGEVRVFYNSCSHRATQVETKRMGNRKQFQCPYHRWTFNTRGELTGCPNNKEFGPGFDKKDYPLGQIRTESFYGLIFVTMSPKTESLEEYLGDAAETLRNCLGGDGRLKLLGYQKVRYQSNWKGYVDGDGYHPPLLHAAFRLLNWQGGKGSQRLATKRGHRLVEAELTLQKDNGFLHDPSLIEFKGKPKPWGSLSVVLFPTFMVVTHLNQINVRFATPKGVDQVEVHYCYFAHADDDEELIRHKVRQGSNMLGPSGMVSMEDAAMFNRVHIGSHTPGLGVFQKGVRDPDHLQVDGFLQNDETPNMAFWEYYREILGIERSAA